MREDEMAQAIELAEYEHTQRRAIRPQAQADGFSHCQDCGDEIPQARRAIKGITRCIDCQQEHELTIKRGL
jgi:RNA polymerase-binding transcription factor DksA